MTHRSRLLPLASFGIFVAACADGGSSAPRAPTAPIPPVPVIGTITGTIEGEVMTATYTPIGGTASPAIYGNQGSTVTVTGTFMGMDSVPGVSKTWKFQVGLRNLQSWPIGSNWGAPTAPPDSSGVFIFFSQPPLPTLPVGCACSITLVNAMGTRDFNNPAQSYYWYNSRPSAYNGVPGSPGDDATTNNPVWMFKTTYGPAPKDTAHAFTFQITVSAAWPPPHESNWLTQYDGTQDTLPDVNGKPLWRRFAVAADPVLGTEAWSLLNQLVLTTASTNTSEYFARNDSLGTQSAVVDVRMKIGNAGSNSYQGIFGLVEPGGKQVFVGMSGSRVGFVNYATGGGGAGAWSGTGISCLVATCGAMTAYHDIRLRKYGIDSVVVCVNGTRRFKNTYGALQASTASFNPASMLFGSGHNIVTSSWSSVKYTYGTAGTGCT